MKNYKQSNGWALLTEQPPSYLAEWRCKNTLILCQVQELLFHPETWLCMDGKDCWMKGDKKARSHFHQNIFLFWPLIPWHSPSLVKKSSWSQGRVWMCVGEGSSAILQSIVDHKFPVFPLLTTLPLRNCASLPWPKPRWGFMNCCLIWQSRPAAAPYFTLSMREIFYIVNAGKYHKSGRRQGNTRVA